MNEIYGDLVALAKQGAFDVIVHGCNCFCVMGAGIAKQIKMSFTEAWRADLNTVSGKLDKLGSLSYAYCGIGGGDGVIIVNAYTQYGYGRGLQVDYTAIRSCMKQIRQQFAGKSIGMPIIGAGLGGGEWETIQAIIVEELKDEDLTIVRYQK